MAEEVRNLASKAAEAAKETSTLIEGSIEKVQLRPQRRKALPPEKSFPVK